MNVHLEKKRGFTHVNASRVVRVTKPHRVPTETWFGAIAEVENGPKRWPEPRPEYVIANVGDLAIEMRAGSKPTGNLAGYSYLSGDAIQLHCYDADSDWFAAGTAIRFHVPRPKPGPEQWAPVVDALLSAKYGDADLAVFRYRCTRREDPQNVAKGIMHFYKESDTVEYRRPLEELRTHVLGDVLGRRRGGTHLHFQPTCDASAFGATPFQIALALGGFK